MVTFFKKNLRSDMDFVDGDVMDPYDLELINMIKDDELQLVDHNKGSNLLVQRQTKGNTTSFLGGVFKRHTNKTFFGGVFNRKKTTTNQEEEEKEEEDNNTSRKTLEGNKNNLTRDTSRRKSGERDERDSSCRKSRKKTGSGNSKKSRKSNKKELDNKLQHDVSNECSTGKNKRGNGARLSIESGGTDIGLEIAENIAENSTIIEECDISNRNESHHHHSLSKNLQRVTVLTKPASRKSLRFKEDVEDDSSSSDSEDETKPLSPSVDISNNKNPKILKRKLTRFNFAPPDSSLLQQKDETILSSLDESGADKNKKNRKTVSFLSSGIRSDVEESSPNTRNQIQITHSSSKKCNSIKSNKKSKKFTKTVTFISNTYNTPSASSAENCSSNNNSPTRLRDVPTIKLNDQEIIVTNKSTPNSLNTQNEVEDETNFNMKKTILSKKRNSVLIMGNNNTFSQEVGDIWKPPYTSNDSNDKKSNFKMQRRNTQFETLKLSNSGSSDDEDEVIHIPKKKPRRNTQFEIDAAKVSTSGSSDEEDTRENTVIPKMKKNPRRNTRFEITKPSTSSEDEDENIEKKQRNETVVGQIIAQQSTSGETKICDDIQLPAEGARETTNTKTRCSKKRNSVLIMGPSPVTLLTTSSSCDDYTKTSKSPKKVGFQDQQLENDEWEKTNSSHKKISRRSTRFAHPAKSGNDQIVVVDAFSGDVTFSPRGHDNSDLKMMVVESDSRNDKSDLQMMVVESDSRKSIDDVDMRTSSTSSSSSSSSSSSGIDELSSTMTDEDCDEDLNASSRISGTTTSHSSSFMSSNSSDNSSTTSVANSGCSTNYRPTRITMILAGAAQNTITKRRFRMLMVGATSIIATLHSLIYCRVLYDKSISHKYAYPLVCATVLSMFYISMQGFLPFMKVFPQHKMELKASLAEIFGGGFCYGKAILSKIRRNITKRFNGKKLSQEERSHTLDQLTPNGRRHHNLLFGGGRHVPTLINPRRAKIKIYRRNVIISSVISIACSVIFYAPLVYDLAISSSSKEKEEGPSSFKSKPVTAILFVCGSFVVPLIVLTLFIKPLKKNYWHLKSSRLHFWCEIMFWVILFVWLFGFWAAFLAKRWDDTISGDIIKAESLRYIAQLFIFFGFTLSVLWMTVIHTGIIEYRKQRSIVRNGAYLVLFAVHVACFIPYFAQEMMSALRMRFDGEIPTFMVFLFMLVKVIVQRASTPWDAGCFMYGVIFLGDSFVNYVFLDQNIYSAEYWFCLVLEIGVLILRDADLWSDLAFWLKQKCGSKCGHILLLIVELLAGDTDDVGNRLFRDIDGTMQKGKNSEAAMRKQNIIRQNRIRAHEKFTTEINDLCVLSEVLSTLNVFTVIYLEEFMNKYEIGVPGVTLGLSEERIYQSKIAMLILFIFQIASLVLCNWIRNFKMTYRIRKKHEIENKRIIQLQKEARIEALLEEKKRNNQTSNNMESNKSHLAMVQEDGSTNGPNTQCCSGEQNYSNNSNNNCSTKNHAIIVVPLSSPSFNMNPNIKNNTSRLNHNADEDKNTARKSNGFNNDRTASNSTLSQGDVTINQAGVIDHSAQNISSNDDNGTNKVSDDASPNVVTGVLPNNNNIKTTTKLNKTTILLKEEQTLNKSFTVDLANKQKEIEELQQKNEYSIWWKLNLWDQHWDLIIFQAMSISYLACYSGFFFANVNREGGVMYDQKGRYL